MNIKLARTEITAKPVTIASNKLIEEAKEVGQKIFYFDRDNSHKDMMNLIDAFEEGGFNIYFREIKFGLDENDYMYEIHVI